MLILVARTGQPALPNPHQRNPPKRHNRHAPKPHQHRLLNSLQRRNLPNHDIPLLLLHAPHPHHGPPTTGQQKQDPLWSLHTWTIRHGDKCGWALLGRFHRYIRGVSDGDAGDGCEYELCVFGVWERGAL